MLKNLFICILILCVFMPFQLSWAEDFNLRYTRWGMTQEEVIKSEEKIDPVDVTENLIQYKTQVMRNKVELNYIFVDNKLIGAKYKVIDNYLNSDHFKSTYTKFKNALIRKYGKPTEERTAWINNTYKNSRNKWGLALSLGHVEYASSWRTNSTEIDCSLRQKNHYVLCLIEYWSIEYSDMQKGLFKKDKAIEIKQADKLDPL